MFKKKMGIIASTLLIATTLFGNSGSADVKYINQALARAYFDNVTHGTSTAIRAIASTTGNCSLGTTSTSAKLYLNSSLVYSASEDKGSSYSEAYVFGDTRNGQWKIIGKHGGACMGSFYSGTTTETYNKYY